MIDPLKSIYEAILKGDAPIVEEAVQSTINAGFAPEEILRDGMISAMAEVGRLFEAGEYYVPEMLVAARAMQAGLGILRPFLIDADVQPIGTVILGTVKGDLHDIGKNLVGMMLQGNGFEIIDLGTDVPPEQFVETAKEKEAKLVAMSALLTTTMSSMKSVIEAFEAGGIRDSVKIIIGGAPVTENYAESIGADGYAPDASKAVGLAKSLIENKS